MELGGRRFESLAEANEAVREIMARRNSAPLAEFSGLSADQMFRFIHFPFDSPNLVQFSERFVAPKDSPVMLLFASLAEAIGTEGLRAAAKGNLPRDYCRETHRRFGAICPPDSASSSHFFKLTGEEDFLELHLVRLAAGLAGLLRKQRGRFLLTAKGKEAAADASGGLAFSALPFESSTGGISTPTRSTASSRPAFSTPCTPSAATVRSSGPRRSTVISS